jgi:serine/threonine-protein kinase
MGENDRLENLLRRWQQSAEQSCDLSPEELCRECPDLLPLLRQRIEALRQGTPSRAAANTPDQDPPTLVLDPPPEAAADLVRIPGCMVEAELGRGGMGLVLRARDLTLGRPLAVKVLLARHGHHSEMEQRFLEEAQVMGQLQHPGVPAVHQLGRLADGRPYFSMKLVRGQTLAQLLKERGLPAEELPRFLAIFAQVCETVGYAHSRGILHRDLKPSNIMVGAFGEVQVMDWGLAKVLGRPAAGYTEGPSGGLIATLRTQEGLSSQAGTVVGTPAYMASEQARGEVDSLDERADVFGLGAILCVILTGEPPYRGGREALYQQAAQGELTEAFARLQASGADAELLTLARDCLAGDRDQRPRTAGVVAERMTAYQRGVQERLRQAEMAQERAQARADEERKRRRVQQVLAAVVLLVVLGGGAAAWVFQQERQARAAERAGQQRAADAAADQAMAKARLLLDQAKATPLQHRGRLQEALAEAQKAEEVARTGGASVDVRQRATALARQIDQEQSAAQRDQRLLTELLEVRGPREGPRFKVDERGLVLQLAEPSADEQFVAAFRRWGLDVDATPRASALTRLKERPAAVLVEVIAALDEWAGERRRRHQPAARWRHLAELAEGLDTPDSKRRELRGLLARGTLPLERALGTLSAALRPVPLPVGVGLGKDCERLRRLAAGVDAAREPVLGLLTLVRALSVAGEEALAEDLLRTAVRARPQEVVLHHGLGQLLASKTPPEWSKVLECYGAARTLRPDLGDSLAHALVQVGRAGEGLALYERLAADSPSNPWLHSRRGYALYKQGRFPQAEAAYRDVLRLKPRSPTAHVALAAALFYQGRLEQAEAVARKGVGLWPNDHVALANLGAILAAQGRSPEAETVCREALRHAPNYRDALINLGVALRDQGRAEEAEAEYRKAIGLEPAEPGAHNNLALALRDQRRFKEAEVSCREAIRLNPEFSDAHSNLGLIFLDQGRDSEAETSCRAAVRLAPGSAQARYPLARALLAQGQVKEAETVCRAALRLKPADANLHCALGAALYGQARVREAEASFREALRLKPEFPEALYNLGSALADQNRHKEAEASCRAAIRLNADDPKAHNNLGIALQGQKRHKEAEAAFREALRLNPGDAGALNNLATSLVPQGRLKEAETLFREALRRKPAYAEAHYNLGNALGHQGRFREAEASCREAIRLKPDLALAYYDLGNALDRQKQPREAEAAYRQLLRLRPEMPEAHCNLGSVLRQQGRFAESLEAYRKGHALGSKRQGWAFPSARWVREGERLLVLDAKLPAILKGSVEAASAAERLEWALLCRHPARRLHAAAVRFAAEAFADEPKLADDLTNQPRYQAACSGALAAAGNAADTAKLTGRERAALRTQALKWLRADLTVYAALAARDGGKWKRAVRQRLAHWQRDPDLDSIREQDSLHRLSDGERDAWRQFWEDVEQLRQQLDNRGPRTEGPARPALHPRVHGVLNALALLQPPHHLGKLLQRQAVVDKGVHLQPPREQVVAGLRHVARREVEAAQ